MTSERVDGQMKTQRLEIVGLALFSVAMLLAVPWLIRAHSSLDDRSALTADVTGGREREISEEARPHPAQHTPTQASSAWQIQIVDQIGVGSYTSLALDADGYPHISYYDQGQKNLKYARWTGQTWISQTVHVGEDIGLYTSLALDAAGNPRISYFDRAHDDLWYASWTGSDWDRQQLHHQGFAGLYPSLALGADDRPQIGYSAEGDIMHIRWTGSEWRVRRVDNMVENVGLGLSMALDGYEDAHITYSDAGSRKLKYAHWTGSEWEILTIDDDGQMRWPSLKLDADGHAHVSYCNYDYGNSELKYARWTGSDWDIQTVDHIGGQGCHTSLALDADERPHITYYDDTKSRLRYARWTGSTWLLETVDIGGGTGNSLALDDNGRPQISYYDQVNDALMHATESAPSDLSTSVKTAYSSQIETGMVISYVIRLVNTGDLYQSTPFTLTDAIPANTTYVPGSAWASGGSLGDVGGITWNGTILGSQSLSATFAVRVDPTVIHPTAIVNNAILTDRSDEPLTLSATVVVHPLQTYLPFAANDR